MNHSQLPTLKGFCCRLSRQPTSILNRQPSSLHKLRTTNQKKRAWQFEGGYIRELKLPCVFHLKKLAAETAYSCYRRSFQFHSGKRALNQQAPGRFWNARCEFFSQPHRFSALVESLFG